MSDDPPALRDQRAHVGSGGPRVLELLGDGAPLALADQRVAAHRDDGGVIGQRHAVTCEAPAQLASAPAEAVQGRLGDARADLADARLAMSDARVDDWGDAAVHHAPRVDAGGSAREAEGRNAIVVVAREGDACT